MHALSSRTSALILHALRDAFLVAAAVISSARERIRGSRRDPRWARPPASVGGKVEGASRPTFHTHTSKSQHQRGRQLTKASQHAHGISRAKSFDLEVTPWAPARLTSCTFHPGPAEASGAPTLEPGPAQQFRRVEFPPNRLASLQRARLSSASPKLQPDRGGPGAGSGYPSVLIS